MSARTCAHERCGCAPDADLGGLGAYCSRYCANAARESLPGEADLPGACSCRHADCGATTPGAAGPDIDTSTGRT